MNILVYRVAIASFVRATAEGDPSLLSRSRDSSVISTVDYGQQLISSPELMTRPTAYNNNSSIILSTQRRRELETVIDSSGQQVNFSYDTTFSCPATVICHPICVADVANCPVDAMCPDNNYEVRLFVHPMHTYCITCCIASLLKILHTLAYFFTELSIFSIASISNSTLALCRWGMCGYSSWGELRS